MTGQTVPVSKEHLTQYLEAEMFSGRLGAGSKLPSERQLAERFNVSRPLVREVLRTLQERGLVESMPGRGSFVRALSWTDAARPITNLFRSSRPTPRDLIEARSVVEIHAARLAAGRSADEDLSALRTALAGYEATGDVFARVRADVDFHGAVVRASSNPVLEIMFGAITPLLCELMVRSLGDPRVRDRANNLHPRILEAIGRGDPDEAERAVIEHNDLARRTYGEDLDRPLELVAQSMIERLLRGQ